MVLIASWTFQRLSARQLGRSRRREVDGEMEGGEGKGEGRGNTYCSMETLFPIPPNSPWKPIREGSYGLEGVE